MLRLVLMRHGQSRWNLENRFTGWEDIDLSMRGLEAAREAGRLLKEHGFQFDLAYTSVLKRAILTVLTVLYELDQPWIPVKKDWRLNERHYGSLQGQDKDEVRGHFGPEQVRLWRRGFSVAPPPMPDIDPRHPRFDVRYRHLDVSDFGGSESLERTMERALDFWHECVLPSMTEGERVIIAAHCNTFRALIKHLDGMSESDVMGLEIPTAVPRVYEFNDRFEVLTRYYLADPATFGGLVDERAAKVC